MADNVFGKHYALKRALGMKAKQSGDSPPQSALENKYSVQGFGVNEWEQLKRLQKKLNVASFTAVVRRALDALENSLEKTEAVRDDDRE